MPLETKKPWISAWEGKDNAIMQFHSIREVTFTIIKNTNEQLIYQTSWQLAIQKLGTHKLNYCNNHFK